jgi:hypothetical protein
MRSVRHNPRGDKSIAAQRGRIVVADEPAQPLRYSKAYIRDVRIVKGNFAVTV